MTTRIMLESSEQGKREVECVTVKELMNSLEKVPDDKAVLLYNTESKISGPIEDIRDAQVYLTPDENGNSITTDVILLMY